MKIQVFASLAAVACAAASFAIDRTVPGMYPTIQAAVNASQNGDRVLVAPGTYNESVTINNKQISIIGAEGPGLTKIDRQGAGGNVFDFSGYNSSSGTPALLVEGFTITRCGDSAIRVSGSGAPRLTVRDVRIISGSRGIFYEAAGLVQAIRYQAVLMSNPGGGAYLRPDAGGTFTDCAFTNCNSHEGAAIFGESSNPIVMTGCTFSNCSGVNGTVRISGASSLSATSCTWSSCSGGSMSCAYIQGSSTAIFSNCNFFDNPTINIYSTSSGIVKVVDCAQRGRWCGRHSFLYTGSGAVELIRLTSTNGGGYSDGNEQGGFLLSAGGRVTLTECNFVGLSNCGNPGSGGGGVLKAYGGSEPVTIERCNFAFTSAANENQSGFRVDGRPLVIRDTLMTAPANVYGYYFAWGRSSASMVIERSQFLASRLQQAVWAENVALLECRESEFRRILPTDGWGELSVYLNGTSVVSRAVIEDCVFASGQRAIYRESAVGGSAVEVHGCFFQDCNGSPSAIYSQNAALSVYDSLFRSAQYHAIAVGGGSYALLGGNHFCGTQAQELGSLPFVVKGRNIFSANCTSDCDSDGIPDLYEIEGGYDTDCNNNGVPDSCDSSGAGPDCNKNGIPDLCDIAGGAPDCNGNGVVDSCEADCDSDGVPDACEISSGASDCNQNGIPDSCESDCDTDGIPDACEIASGAADCDADGVPDACEIAAASTLDINRDGILDACQPNMQYAGLQMEIHPIVARGTDDLFPSGAVCYRLYARVTNPAASVLGVYGNASFPMLLSASGGFWQSPFGSDLASDVPCASSSALPSFKYDSWFTVGLACEDGNAAQNVGLDLAGFNAGGVVNDNDGLVFVGPGSPQAIAGSAKRVLLAQLTTTQPVFVSGRVNVVGRSSQGSGEASSWIALGQQIPMPALVDCNANGIHDAFDIAQGTAKDCDQSGIPDSCEHPSAGTDCNNNGISDLCDCYSGFSSDVNTNNVPDECECQGDIDANGRVDVDDLIEVLVAWGSDGSSDADVNSDGIVNADDLGVVLSGWGQCL
jgi:hypothetical protein